MSQPSSARMGLPGLHSPAAGFDQPFEMLAACHERVQRSLDLLARLLAHLQARAAKGQGADDAARSAAADVARYFNLAAPQHHQDEERHVIPWLLAQGQPEQAQAARQMLVDHRVIEAVWARLAPALAALQDGEAIDLNVLQADAQAFIDVHAGHIVLENGTAFPAAQAALDPSATRLMGEEMAARRRPG